MESSPTHPRRRFRRWLGAVAVLLVVSAAGALYHYTRPATLAALILPRASKALGGDVQAERIEFTGLSKLRFTELSVRVPGWDGPAGEILRANSLEVHFSLMRILFGELFVHALDVDSLRLRLAESGDAPGKFSVFALDPSTADAKGDAKHRPDSISVRELVIENGVLAKAGYQQLGELKFEGSMTPAVGSATAFEFTLRGRPDRNGELSIGSITGSYDPETEALSVNCDDLEIDSKRLAIAPTVVRRWMNKLDVEGRIARLQFDSSPAGEPFALIDLRGAAVNLPVDSLSGGALANAWGGFAGGKDVDLVATPRMKLDKGLLRLERNELRFDQIEGSLGAADDGRRVIPLPFKGNLKVRLPVESLPPFEWEQRDTWFENAARIAPFDISLEIPSFASQPKADGAPDVVQLPRGVTRLLADFDITRWKIRVTTTISRGAPSPEGIPGEVRSQGELGLEQGSGAFEEFPYRLDDVAGTIAFNDDNVVIKEIKGKGGDGAEVTITGKLDGIAKGALIDLAIECADAPIDAQLFNAFEEAPREALQLLFDERADRQLGAAGLLPDAGHVAAQRSELTRLGSDESKAALRARLERSRDAGAFKLGGRCGFSMRVFSEAGFGKPVEVTGTVRVRDAGLLFTRFPYPLRLKAGSFRVLDEAIEIADGGITAVTPAGGLLTVAGRVDIPRLPDKTRGMRAKFEIRDEDDALNPALLAAIPHSGREMPAGWPGTSLAPAGELLASLGLSGTIALNGSVEANARDSENFAFTIDFRDGKAAPDEAGRAALAEDGLPWPPDFTLTNCKATIELSPEKVVLRDCTGECGSGSIAASATAELEGPGRVIDIVLNSIPIGRAFEGYLAPDAAEASASFTRYAPTGSISGSVRREVDATGARTSGELLPAALELTLDGSRMRIERTAGAIAVDASGLRAQDLAFRLSEGEAHDGELVLNGRLSGEDGEKGSGLTASLAGCRVESPLVRELLTQRAKGVLDLLKNRNARGRFDATFERAETERFRITPRELALGQADAAVEFTFQDGDFIGGDGAKVDFDLHGALHGTHSGSIEMKGAYESATDNRLHASMRLVSDSLSPALRQQLPPPLDFAAKERDVTASRRFELTVDDASLYWPLNGNAAEPDLYTLRGSAHFEGASFNAGTRFTEIDCDLPIDFRYEPRGATPIRFTATMNAKGGRVFERWIGATRATLASTNGGRGFSVRGSGDVSFGRFDLESDLDFDKDSYAARIRIAEADYDHLRAGSPASDESARSSGKLSGVVNLRGSLSGSADTRTGDGRLTIRNATLASMPVAMRVLQLTQLMLPMSSQISATDAEFTIRGNTAEVGRCTLNAGTIDLEGKGTVDLPTFAVGMRLFAKGTIPLLSDVIGGVTSQIFAVDVSGTLSDPKASIAALPGTTEAPTAPVTPAEQPQKDPSGPADPPGAAPKEEPKREEPKKRQP